VHSFRAATDAAGDDREALWARGKRDETVRRLLALADSFAIVAAMGLAALASSGRADRLGLVALGTATLPVWILILKCYGLYDRDIKRISHTTVDDLPWIAHAVLVGGLLLWVYFKVLPVDRLELLEMVAFGGAALVAIPGLRALVRALAPRVLGPERVLFVGHAAATRLLARKISSHPEYGLKPVGVVSNRPESRELPVLGGLGDVDFVRTIKTHRVDRVVVAHVELEEEEMLELVRTCRRLSTKVSVLPQLFDAMGPSLEVDDVEGVTVLGLNPPVLSPSSLLVKRVLDLAIAIPLLLVAAPFMAIIAVIIKLDSRGPVLFVQQRVGRGGVRFKFIKFRTMIQDAEALRADLLPASADPGWLSVDHDPRITRFGHFLRLSSLDELPQLWNVIKGEMSLVGPRPLIEDEDRQLVGWRRSRIDLTPGLTGLWQVLGRTSIPFDEMIKLDYVYVTNWSLWTDVRLMLRTLAVVLKRRGAN
jgi:exopolysaccharide biosynthesis polyprenyl glycosylphosphotransferase